MVDGDVCDDEDVRFPHAVLVVLLYILFFTAVVTRSCFSLSLIICTHQYKLVYFD
ncbi:unnamed protein product [Amoebophrya sp. A120]|nr:unnamed protein product [Amoebophrya sp. A120]|eukprot:GSA120T00024603001.1